MRCPFCSYGESKVVDSRPTDDGERIRRRRECLRCQRRFTTYEAIETVPLMVLKKDGSIEGFDRNKLFNSNAARLRETTGFAFPDRARRR